MLSMTEFFDMRHGFYIFALIESLIAFGIDLAFLIAFWGNYAALNQVV